MNIFNIENNYSFLKSLSDFIFDKIAKNSSLSNITILLPSRRSCNELKKIFLEKSSSRAILLPNIKAIGDIDYDDIILKQLNKDDLKKFKDFSSNTSRVKYKVLLIKELLKWAQINNSGIFYDLTVEQACGLSLELEKFLNEVSKNGLDLADLSSIVDDEYSGYWQEVLGFLQVFGKKWNDFIMENNLISLAEFKTKMIEFNAEFFEKNKPINPIIIAGVSGSTKATCNLIKSLLKYDNCYYVLKGFDGLLNDEEWNAVSYFHHQYSIKKLFDDCLSFDRKNVKNIAYFENLLTSGNLNKILSYSMLPYSFTYKWQDKLNLTANDLSNIKKIECENEFVELNVISYILKFKIINGYRNIAVIVSNDVFADQLEIKLNSIGLNVNNAFGNKISRTEFVKFLFLILDVVKNDYEPIALLSLLKHNFSLFGFDKEKLESLILKLENEYLRGNGHLPYNKLIGIVEDLEIKEFLEKINTITSLKKCNNFAETLKLHIEIAEKIASNDKINASEIFWKNEKSGNEILNFFNEIIVESKSYGEIKDLDEYSNILNYLIAENSYSEKFSVNPLINILSTAEAKLLDYDFAIVANLNEGFFPPYISSDPWMSNSMRKSFDLQAKEEIIGSFANDFVQLLSSREVVLTRSLKDAGVPTTPSKYLMRFETFLRCQGLAIENIDVWKEVVFEYNRVDDFKIISRPKPTPPLDSRPKKLFATQIEKLINNPYDIYSKDVLKLKKNKDFYEDNIFANFGTATHKALEDYTKNYNPNLSIGDKIKKLTEFGLQSFKKYIIDESSRELFFIRFINIANWFVREDQKIRDLGYEIIVEETKEYKFDDLNFTIAAKIDRIEKNEFGVVNICDYKTGTIPSDRDVSSGKKPQLVIEAIIIENDKIRKSKVEKLVYWSISGKGDEEIMEIKADMDCLLQKGTEGVRKLIAYFNEW